MRHLLLPKLETSRTRPLMPPVESMTVESIGAGYEHSNFLPSDVVSACIERIALLEPFLNAFIAINSRMLEDAAMMDAEIAAGGRRGPLHGVRDFFASVENRRQLFDCLLRRDHARRCRQQAGGTGWSSAGSKATSPGITMTATQRLVTAWRIAISSTRGICAGEETSSQNPLHSRKSCSGWVS